MRDDGVVSIGTFPSRIIGGARRAKRPRRVAGALLPVVVLVLVGCTGVEFLDERYIEIGRDNGSQLVRDVHAGRLSWEEAHDICSRMVRGLIDEDVVSDEKAHATGIGCHEAITEAEEAGK